MQQGILQNYKRIPKIYIKLPSGGYYYKDLNFAIDNTLPVRSMTARDELLLKSPDALLNGDAILRIIQSCCPEITFDPKHLVAPDVEAILLAIFHASFSNNLEFETSCPKCNTSNIYTADVSSVLMTTKTLEPPYIVRHIYNEKELKVYVKPITYETLTLKSLTEFENAKMMQSISSESLNDLEKLEHFNLSFNKLAEYKFNAVCDSIEKIVVEEGEVTNKEEIKNFIFEADSDLINKIDEKLKEINNSSINNDFQAKCQNKQCEHEWTTKVEFDPARFFVASFKR